MADRYDGLRLENQLCFPLYACAKEVVRQYKPFLDPLDLTYTQYLVMLVLWEWGQISSRALGRKLYLDSGTLTPVLKKLEQKGLLTRKRDPKDERNLIVAVTEAGTALREQAADIPARMGSCLHMTAEEGAALYQLLYKLLGQMEP